jgi:putative toxin-antitoxin system antitoxin component (TIGR02293 family)
MPDTKSSSRLLPTRQTRVAGVGSERTRRLGKLVRRRDITFLKMATDVALAEPMDQVELEREGVPAAVVVGLAKEMALPRIRIFEMMNLPRATMEKKISGDEVLTGVASRRVLNLLRLLAHAREILKDSTSPEADRFDVARWLGRWIETPQPALGGKKPADLLDTETGAAIVERTLGAVRSGAYL